VALLLMDYPNRRRLKILARITTHDLAAEPELASRLGNPGYRARPERTFTLKLQAFDWNCPQHITPRFTEAEFTDAMAHAARLSDQVESGQCGAHERRGAHSAGTSQVM